jgi:hypothetical protein
MTGDGPHRDQPDEVQSSGERGTRAVNFRRSQGNWGGVRERRRCCRSPVRANGADRQGGGGAERRRGRRNGRGHPDGHPAPREGAERTHPIGAIGRLTTQSY